MQLKKHGGIKEDADMTDVNLAYPLEDGMKIHISSKKEKEEQNKIQQEQTTAGTGITTNSGGVLTEEKKELTQTNSKVNINTATQTQLETLPGIGSSIANKILEYRKENGKFNTIEDIKKVNGIGEAKFEKMKNYIMVK